MRKRIIYYCSSWPSSWLLLPVHAVQALALRARVEICHHGIRIADLTPNEDPTVFVQATVACLDLIRDRSTLQFRRLQRYVRYIANSPIYQCATYLSRLRAVKIDFAKVWRSEHEDRSLRIYAMTLVHEAAHGYLDARFIPYTKNTRRRIEYICEREANRFVNHLGNEWSHLHRTFSESNWDTSWNASRFKKVRLQIERSRREFRKR